MHGSNCSYWFFVLSISIEHIVTFLKNDSIYDDTNTPTQPPPYFDFLSSLLKEYACFQEVKHLQCVGTGYDSSSREATVLSFILN